MSGVYLHNWADSKLGGVCDTFRLNIHGFVHTKILLASYHRNPITDVFNAFVLYQNPVGNMYIMDMLHRLGHVPDRDEWQPTLITYNTLIDHLESDAAYGLMEIERMGRAGSGRYRNVFRNELILHIQSIIKAQPPEPPKMYRQRRVKL